MQACELWNSSTRFIEIGTRGRPIVGTLLRQGFVRCLCVARTSGQCDRIRVRHPEVGSALTTSGSRNLVRQNNAEVLVLGSRAATSTFRFRNLRHATHVALADWPWPGFLLALTGCLLQMLAGRLARPVRVQLEIGGKTSLLVFPVRRRKLPDGARHYIPHALGLQGFLDQLRTGEVRHAVLRWFDDLPQLPAGEDLDLLVADAQLPAVLNLLESGPGVQPCDIYSETGIPRSDFRKMPYFPPRLAAQILEGALPHRGLCRVPSPEHHLLSIIYHALYHKGPASGIPESSAESTTHAGHDHNYPRIIAELARSQGLKLTVTRDGLETFLASRDWRPPRDMLLRLSKRNRWVRATLGSEPERAEDRGLATFIIREKAMQRGGLNLMTALLEHHGFTIIQVKELAGDDQARVTANVRGGNWGRGPWPISGGEPAAVIVAFDPNPMPLSRKQRKKFPLATNARLLSKASIRDAFNEGLPAEEHCNVVHSSDNGHEAWEYIELAMPEQVDEIRQRLTVGGEQPECDVVVLKDLTRFGRRTRVELLELGGTKAVRKTFKPGCERFCRREEHAMRELSRQVPELPRLIDSSQRTVTYPYFDDVLQYDRSSGWLISRATATQAIEALRHVYEAGYALIDASIDNVLVDRVEGLKLIDFEFLHRYESRPATFAESYDIAGCPRDFSGDLPSGGGKNYRQHWQPYVGLSLESLLHDPAWLQIAKRTLYVALRPHRYWPRRLRHAVRRARTWYAPRHTAADAAASRATIERRQAA